ncbi:gliding motility-associated C-terminal domain-containing protein [Tamlana sp. 2201CG12-4]|uniref:T9SS type B sorting domain-containing protein n=1 Tax=Tamlana sp. 2201CG12-4 TaxID=3112582 RepID=UPI002DBDB8B4|nr:gliding motility-associated C-terminal domain-containing protein [Tamlana sp. 2201CG12-4]MEC3906463.1 gliding motility-associated C-terminal domain-containing protein [Tamlana sp. 2201CG12-4]
MEVTLLKRFVNKMYECLVFNDKKQKPLVRFIITLLMFAGSYNAMSQDTRHYIPAMKDHSSALSIVVYMANSADVPATVNFYDSTGAVAFGPITVPAEGGASVNVTSGLRVTASHIGKTSKGLIAESDIPISLSTRTSVPNQLGHIVSKGSTALGTTFRGAGMPMFQQTPNTNIEPMMSMIASEDNTVITITYPNGIVETSPSLNRGESYYVGLNASSAINISRMHLIMGALVESDKPIAVTVGAVLASIIGAPSAHRDVYIGTVRVGSYNSHDSGIDCGFDQIVPVENLGKEYVFNRINGSNYSEVPMIVAHYNNTSVYINGNETPIITLAAGEWVMLDGDYTNDYYAGGAGAGLDGLIPDATGFYPPTGIAPPSGGLVGGQRTEYTDNFNMYVRTSTPCYAYQSMAGSRAGSTQGFFYVPPLICSAPRVAYVPAPDIGPGISMDPGVSILTRASASITIGGQSLESLLAAGTVLNYDTNNPNGNYILGFPQDFVTYKLTFVDIASAQALYTGGANGYLEVTSTSDLYMSAYGYSGGAGHGGYYSGFAPTFEITKSSDCFPSTLEGPESYDYYQWYKNGIAISGARSRTYVAQEESGVFEYYLEAGYTGCDPIRSVGVFNFTATSGPLFLETNMVYCSLDFSGGSPPTIQDLEDDIGVELPLSVNPGENLLNNIKWYAINPAVTPPGVGNPELAKTDVLTSTTTSYFVVYSPDPLIDPCFSAVPVEIVAEVSSPTPVPTYADTNIRSVTFCAGDEPTVNDLTELNLVNYTGPPNGNIVWYANDYVSGNIGELPISSTSLLTNNSFYYAVSNDNSGACEYTNRLPIKVFVEGDLSFSTGLGETAVCDNVDATLTAVVRNNGDASSIVLNGAGDPNHALSTAFGPVEFVWETNTGSGWTVIPVSTGTDGGTVTSTNTDMALATSVIVLDGEYVLAQNTAAGASAPAQYRVRAKLSGCTNEIISTTVINIAGPITITTQPTDDQVACGGDILQLEAEATASFGTLSYIWQQRDDDTVNPGQGTDDNWIVIGSGDRLLVTATTALNTKEYRALISTEYCNGTILDADGDNYARSNVVNIKVDGPIQIDEQAGIVTTCSGVDASFSITASKGAAVPETELVYNWEVDKGSGFEAIAAGDVSGGGIDQDNITITNITTASHGFKYRVSVTTRNISGGSPVCVGAATSTGTLNVEGPITVNTQPLDQVVCDGGLATFAVNASATVGSVSYIWEETSDGGTTWTEIGSGATLLLSNVSSSKHGNMFRALITTGSCTDTAVTNGAIYSASATLTVDGPIFINTPLESISVCDGGQASFTVDADSGVSGSTLRYKWFVRKSGDPGFTEITNGADTTDGNLDQATINLTSAVVTANGSAAQYQVQITTDTCTSPVTSTALITIEGPITTNAPTDIDTCAGSTIQFTADATTPVGSLSYTWFRSTDGGTTFPDIVGTGRVLVLSNVIDSQNGSQYRYVAETAECSVTSGAATLNIEGPIEIDTDLVDQTVCYNGTAAASASFTVAASIPSGTLQYNWYNLTDDPTKTTSLSTTNSLSLTGITDADDGDIYIVEITTTECTEAVISTGQIFVQGPVTVTSQPTAAPSTCEGGSVNLTAGFSNGGSGGINIQWFVDKGSGYQVIGGETSSTITLSGIETSDSGNKYKAVATTPVCDGVHAVETNESTLSVGGGVAIDDSLTNQTVCVGIGARFAVDASIAAGSATYIWEKESSPGSDAFIPVTISETLGGDNNGLGTLDTNELNLLPVAKADISTFNALGYRVRISAGASCSGSEVVTNGVLFVEGPIEVAAGNEPQDIAVCAGGIAIFSVQAEVLTGSGDLSYEWEVDLASDGANDGTWISVAVGHTYVLSGLTDNQNGNLYRVKISSGDGCEPIYFPGNYTDGTQGNVAGNHATLTVEGPINIIEDIEDLTVCDDNSGSVTASFTVNANTGSATPAYQWQRFDLTTNMWTDVIAGETTDGMVDQATVNLANITSANNNTQYRVLITTGECLEPAISEARLNVEGFLQITDPLTDQSACSGDTAIFSTTATTGAGNLSYLWEEETAVGSNSFIAVSNTPSYIKSNVLSSDHNKRIRVTISTGTECAPNVQTALLTVDGPIIITDPIDSASLCDDGSGTVTHTFTVTATTGASTAAYAWYKNGTLLTDTDTASGAVGSASSNTIEVPVTSADNGVAYKVEVTTNAGLCSAKESVAILTVEGPIAITRQPVDIAVCAGGSATLDVEATTASGNLNYRWENSTDNGASWSIIGNSSILLLNGINSAQNGDKYRVVISEGSICSAVISNEITLTVEGPIAIIENLRRVVACDGEPAIFEINAITGGAGILAYQWQQSTDGITFTDIAGETGTTYTRAAVTADNGLIVRVKLSTAQCELISSQALLNVDGPMAFVAEPDSVDTCEGLPAVFSAEGIADNGLITYRWEESTDGGATWRFVAFGSTYAKPGTTISDNGNKYRVSISTEGCNTLVSREAELTVQPVPFIDGDPEDTTAEVGTNVTINAIVSSAALSGYQWQVNDGSGTGWADLSNDGTYVNTNTVSLNIVAAPYAFNGNKYRLKMAIPECNITRISDEATLTLDYDCDGDGILNMTDQDDDNDGIVDVIENYNQDLFGDIDNDNIRNFEDAGYCNLNTSGVCADADTDNDGLINQCDIDSDNNGVLDIIEGAPVINPRDTDRDGIYDFIDTDNDNNGILDVDEIGSDPNNPRDTDGDGTPDYNDDDNDGDGIPDNYEIYGDSNNPMDTDNDGTPDYLDTDSDNDGIPDAYEVGREDVPVNTDEELEIKLAQDVLEDYRDSDSDNNGITDTAEAQGLIDTDVLSPIDVNTIVDTDRDGIPDHLDFDNDGDSLFDACEIVRVEAGETSCDGVFIVDAVSASTALNTDATFDGGDDLYDYMDDDDDGDGFLTLNEDTNGNNNLLDDDCDLDQIPEYRDIDDCDENKEKVISNAFSPNGDGMHDTLEIPYLIDYPDFEMEIFDRRGNLMYSYKDDGDGSTKPDWWNGRIGNEKGKKVVPSANYFYIIKFNKDQKEPKTGWIYLLK